MAKKREWKRLGDAGPAHENKFATLTAIADKKVVALHQGLVSHSYSCSKAFDEISATHEIIGGARAHGAASERSDNTPRDRRAYKKVVERLEKAEAIFRGRCVRKVE